MGYWGDIDTWGLRCLARARSNIDHLEALLMSDSVFETHRAAAVVEPVIAGIDCPSILTSEEQQLYRKLISETKGRLEQEFLPVEVVHEAFGRWLA